MFKWIKYEKIGKSLIRLVKNNNGKFESNKQSRYFQYNSIEREEVSKVNLFKSIIEEAGYEMLSGSVGGYYHNYAEGVINSKKVTYIFGHREGKIKYVYMIVSENDKVIKVNKKF